MQKKVYNLEIKGGNPFQMEVKGSPLIEHDGRKTFHLVLLSEDQYKELKNHLTSIGVEVVHQFAGSNKVCSPQTPKCVECRFYIAAADSSCGMDIWTDDEVQGYLSSERARKDLSLCPLGKTKNDRRSSN